MADTTARLTALMRHVKAVEANCNIISSKMWLTDQDFALEIAKRGRTHDASKFEKLEFESLWKGEKCFDIALVHHHTVNSHHPEYYPNGIYGMSEVDICEMVCDCVARAHESDCSARIWFLDSSNAPLKYGYKGDKEMYEKLESYLKLLLNEPFN